jgi:hypothetical protein
MLWLKPLKTKLWWNGPWAIPFQTCVRQSDLQPTWSLLLKIKKGDEILKIFISETTGPIGAKLCLYSPWMTPFQNCVRQSRSTNIIFFYEQYFTEIT